MRTVATRKRYKKMDENMKKKEMEEKILRRIRSWRKLRRNTKMMMKGKKAKKIEKEESRGERKKWTTKFTEKRATCRK